jgi:hypothetical protein
MNRLTRIAEAIAATALAAIFIVFYYKFSPDIQAN